MKKEILQIQLKDSGSFTDIVDSVQLKVQVFNERKVYTANLNEPTSGSFIPFDEVTDDILFSWSFQIIPEKEINNYFVETEHRKSKTLIKSGSSFTPREHAKEWKAGVQYNKGDKVYYKWEDSGSENTEFYEAIQDHTSQEDWTPRNTAALFKNNVYFGDESGEGYPKWEQPRGAHDAYSMNRIVNYSGSLYQSDVDANVWEPPTEWSVYDPNSTEPTGSEDSGSVNTWEVGVNYISADIVEYSGSDYICLQDHTSQVGWEPDVATSLWNVYTSGSESGSVEEWTQPNNAQQAYNSGFQVLYSGSVYESNVDANTWEPPTQWTLI